MDDEMIHVIQLQVKIDRPAAHLAIFNVLLIDVRVIDQYGYLFAAIRAANVFFMQHR